MDESSSAAWAGQIASCARSFATGDLAALGRLFDLTAPRLVRFAQAITRNREDAEDAVQAALVRIARNPEALAAVQLPWAYLLRTVRNESLRILSRRRSPLAFWTEFSQVRPEPAQLETHECESEVQQALRKLPAEQAEVVILKIWEGMTFQEVAAVTGESANTVASRYRYALTKLECTLRRLANEVGYVVDP